MNDTQQEEPEGVTLARPAAPSPVALVGLLVRMLARLWIVLLLLGGAALGGVAVTQVFQKRAELEAMRAEPGPSAYAVVAYRAELERQIQAISADRRAEAVPQPPSRPPILEEIDVARARNETVTQVIRSESLGTISAPP
jgi:hypothetical protein